MGLERVGCRGLVWHIVQGLPSGASRGSSGHFTAVKRALRWRFEGIKKGCGTLGRMLYGGYDVLDKKGGERPAKVPGEHPQGGGS